MALKLRIEINNTGVFAEYHRITPLDLNTVRRESWLTQADKQAGKLPVDINTCNLEFTKQACRNDTVADETRVDDIVKRAAYSSFKTAHMSGAEDV
jgi:hypothetical protein